MFVYPSDALTYRYLHLVLTNDGARFSVSSSRVLCAPFMFPADCCDILRIYFFSMGHDNVRKRGRHVLVPLLARRINTYFEFDFDLDRAPCFSLVACLQQKDDGDDNAIAVCLWSCVMGSHFRSKWEPFVSLRRCWKNSADLWMSHLLRKITRRRMSKRLCKKSGLDFKWKALQQNVADMVRMQN